MKSFSAEIPAYLPDGFFWVKAVLSDLLLLEDRFLFSKHGPAHRTELPSVNQKLTIPCHFSSGKSIIKNVSIKQEDNWRNKHWGTIRSRYSHLPYFEFLAPEIEPLYEKTYDSLIKFHFEMISYLKQMWRLPVQIHLASGHFDNDLPGCYIDQWMEKFQFGSYLVFPSEKKYLFNKTVNPRLPFVEMIITDPRFETALKNDVLYLLFLYGTDFPGLVRQNVNLK